MGTHNGISAQRCTILNWVRGPNIRNMFMHSFYINVYKLGCMYYVNVYNLKILTKNFFFILFNLVGIIIFGRGTKEI